VPPGELSQSTGAFRGPYILKSDGGIMDVKLDQVDRDIAAILEENGRISINEIAAALSISEGTVRNRLKKVMDSDYLKIKGLVNPDFSSVNQYIYILVTLQRNDNWMVAAEKVAQLENVKSVSMVTGRFHLVVEVFIDPHSLIDFLTRQLPSIGEIAFTESLVTVKNYNKWV
jgi:Lrp/AsnC family transcriptional regulator for asnA, asnC and gidA